MIALPPSGGTAGNHFLCSALLIGVITQTGTQKEIFTDEYLFSIGYDNIH